MKKILFLVLLFPISVLAQVKDQFSLNYSSSSIKSADTSHSVKVFDAFFAFPIIDNDQNKLTGAINYRQVWLENFGNIYPGEVYGTAVRLNYQRKINAEHQFRVFGQLGAFSDYRNLSGNDLQWTFGTEYITQHQGGYRFGLGIVYAKQFYGSEIAPLIELDEQLSERWRVSGIFPVNPKLEYLLSKKSRTGIELNVDTRTYRFSSAGDDNQYLRTTQYNFMLFYKYEVFKNWSITVKGGVNPKQQVEIYNDSNSSTWTLITIPLGKKPVPVESLHSSSLDGQIGIAYKIF